MNNFRYLPDEGVWRSMSDSGFEILVAGDSTEPNSAHMAFLRELLPHLEDVLLRAIGYLTFFTNPSLKPDWFLEALHILLPNMNCRFRSSQIFTAIGELVFTPSISILNLISSRGLKHDRF